MSRDVDRRTFLRGAAAGSAMALAGGLGLRALLREPERWDEAAFPPPGEARVAVLATSAYDGPLEATVQDGLRAIGADVRGATRPAQAQPGGVRSRTTADQHRSAARWQPRCVALRRMGAVDGPWWARDRGIAATSQFVVTSSGFARRRWTRWTRGSSTSTSTASRRGAAPQPLHGAGRAVAPASRSRDADVVISLPKMKTHHWAG